MCPYLILAEMQVKDKTWEHCLQKAVKCEYYMPIVSHKKEQEVQKEKHSIKSA